MPCRHQSPDTPRLQARTPPARTDPLAPLLEQLGLHPLPREAGNFLLNAHPGLILRENSWRWPDRNMAGNAIGFFVEVQGLAFHDAMRRITDA